MSNSGASFFRNGFLQANMKTAAIPLSPRGYSKLEGRRNQRRNEKGFFVSPDGDSSVQGLLGLEADSAGYFFFRFGETRGFITARFIVSSAF